MKKLMIPAAIAAFIFTSCGERRTETTETTTTETTTIETERDTVMETAPDTVGSGAMYRGRADTLSRQMTTDLRLDTTMRGRLSDIFYNRSLRYGGLDTRYGTDTTGRAAEMRNIDTETDREIKNVLSPTQYRTYETNRSKYSETKYKSGDVKMKTDGTDTKLKTNDTKIKTETR